MCRALELKGDTSGLLRVLYSKAKQCFDEALKFHLDEPRLRIFRIVCLVQLGDMDGALDSINRMLGPRKHPNPEVFILRAKVYWALGLLEEGNKDIRHSVSLIPTHPEVSHMRIFLHACAFTMLRIRSAMLHSIPDPVLHGEGIQEGGETVQHVPRRICAGEVPGRKAPNCVCIVNFER